jgi:putative ABC transport system permease protein
MLKHYLIISARNIFRNKFYSVILVFGLAVGIASSVLLGMFVQNELSFDNFHTNKGRIFLVGVDSKQGEEQSQSGWTTPPTGPAMQEFFPEIETTTRLCFWFDDLVVSQGERRFPEKNVVGADSTIFDIFTIPFVAGDPRTALTEPNSVVISESIARKYFGEVNPLGETLQFESFFSECKVTGIMKDYPDNGHFKTDILFSLSSLKTIRFDFNGWLNHTFSTYALLHPNANAKEIEAKLPDFVRSNLEPYLMKQYKKSYDEIYQGGDYYRLFLMPLNEVHLSTMIFENREGKRLLTYALGVIGMIIIILVCINYTNLATVLSLSRSREVGIRKVTGSRSSGLFYQFIVESILLAFIGLFGGLVLVEFCLPLFNNLTGQSLQLDYSDPSMVATLVFFTVAIGLLSGFYPALTFASFNPIQALKGNTSMKGNNHWIRNGLVVFQFSTCIIMIVSTIVVYKQFSFMTDKNVGFSKDQVLVIKRPDGLGKNKLGFKSELLKSTNIESVSFAQTTPGRSFDGHGQHFAGTPVDQIHTIYPLVADEDILETLGLKLQEGENFKARKSNRPFAILNETAVRTLNLENPLAQRIDRGTFGNDTVEIIGVVKDFNFQSFHNVIAPLVLYSLDVENDRQHRATYILVKIDGHNIPVTIQYIEEKWARWKAR